jgi:gamma-glutamyl hydrolase
MKKRKLVVGVLTVPLSPGSKYDNFCGKSYIVTAHLDWLKSVNIEPLEIPYYSNNFNKYMKKINGLYLPSGGVFAQTQPDYYYAAKKLIQLAKSENDKGNHFPIWGGCMGMQQMLIEADKKDNYINFYRKFNSDENLRVPLLDYRNNNRSSRLFSYFNERKMKEIEERNSSLHNHELGISPSKFMKNKNISKFYKIINISYDRDNKPFVSSIEAYEYPFYGVQWHPERKKNFHKLIEFFKDEVSKNKKKFYKKHTVKNRRMITQKVKCMSYSNNLYKYCNFYWKNKTKKNNPRTCKNVVNIIENRTKYPIIG